MGAMGTGGGSSLAQQLQGMRPGDAQGADGGIGGSSSMPGSERKADPRGPGAPRAATPSPRVSRPSTQTRWDRWHPGPGPTAASAPPRGPGTRAQRGAGTVKIDRSRTRRRSARGR